MRRLLLQAVLVGVILASLAGTASAGTIVTTPGPYQGYIDAARVPTPSMEVFVVVDAAACPGGLGCSIPGSGEIDLSPYVATSRSVFLHEIGHEFDFTVLTAGERERFAAILGEPRRTMPWWSGSYGWSMGEWFADAYMQCARLPRVDPRVAYSVGSGLLAGWRLRRECGLIRYAGASS